ncbi:MAG: hypothetical protein ACLPID_12350 [Beijerinckiaceae bacterium]
MRKLLVFGKKTSRGSVIYHSEIMGTLDSSRHDASLQNMKSSTPSDSLVPSGLVAEIRAAAEEEHRLPSELVGEAVERYLSERRWFRKDDVHTKIAQALESLRQGKGLDGETVMSGLLAELDAPERAR